MIDLLRSNHIMILSQSLGFQPNLRIFEGLGSGVGHDAGDCRRPLAVVSFG
jgi:hypothetical protein